MIFFVILCLFLITTIKLSHMLRRPNTSNIGQFTFGGMILYTTDGNILYTAKLATIVKIEINAMIRIAR